MRGAKVAALLLALAATAAADGASSPRERLFRALGAEAASAREDAARDLEKAADLTEDEVRAELRTASRRATPHLLRLAAARGMKSLVPEIVASLAVPDPLVADAAVRALVTLGEDAVAAGQKALETSKEPGAADTRARLFALGAQRTVEREVLGKWRRKGGTYEGRYKDLAKLGWPVQPVLLAMLLDVPLTVDQIVLPQTKEPLLESLSKQFALASIESSDRRGYRTFDPLPVQIEQEELFDLAAQALKDVADMDLMGDILERVADNLEEIDEARGWRLRPWEETFYREIFVILFARNRPQRLERLAEKFGDRVDDVKRWLARADEAGRRGDPLQQLSQALSDYAGALHQLRRYDEAAAGFAQMIQIGKELTDRFPAIAGYNRACALACAGRKDEAIAQLARALDRELSAGSEDLTREWVVEDGDLASIRDDPRFKALIRKRFDDGGADPKPASADPAEPGRRPAPPRPPK